MPQDNLNVFPKTVRSLETDVDRIADRTYFIALHTGMYSSMYAATNGSEAVCGDDRPLPECPAAKTALQSTVRRVHIDNNEVVTGWIGYEGANAGCDQCDMGCSAYVLWEDGKPTEKMRFVFYDKSEELR